MNIKNLFHKNSKLSLALPTEQQKKLIAKLERQTDALIRRDLADWRRAWQFAINVDHPNRNPLLSIYRDVAIDLHLSGCITQRKGFLKARSFKLSNDKGEEQPDLMSYFDTEWFKTLIDYCQDAYYWGHSLIELGDVVRTDSGMMTYDRVELIPRRHVIPEYHRVVINENEDWSSGIDYHEAPYNDSLIEVGRKDDLGIFLKAATQTIPKKNMLAFWDTFGEIFGMPMRIAHTTCRDEKQLAEMEKMMSNMGTEFWGLFPEGTDIDVVQAEKGDAFNVYDKRIERANSELSKLVIGQTMTIENGSSLSQSQTHLEVFENLVESDCDRIRDIINTQLLPRMVRQGFPLQGIRFDWDYSVDYTPEQQLAYEQMIADRYDVDPKYFEEKYGMPVGNRRQAASPLMNKPSTDFFD